MVPVITIPRGTARVTATMATIDKPYLPNIKIKIDKKYYTCVYNTILLYSKISYNLENML